ncbi:MAG TPA: T9SS type A sorting domain-containing protein [Bacteroidia bacterium]|jgi:hypothetical protein|nr:T9SS type A sorting domain-containing protein [Bacteroidia bacterium]
MKNTVFLFLMFLTGPFGIRSQTAPFPCQLLSVDTIQVCKTNHNLIAVTITNHDTTETWGPTFISITSTTGDSVGSLTTCGCVILFKGTTGTFNLTAKDTTFKVPANYCCNITLKGSGSVCFQSYDRCLATGISPLAKGGEMLNLFPNPANNQVTLDLGQIPSGEVLVSLINMQGQKVYSEIFTAQSAQFDVSKFSKGMYLVQVSGAGMLPSNRKLLVE